VKCSACRATIYSTDNSTIGARVLSRAQQEAVAADFSMAIVLAAMALECHLAFVFFKWKKIDHLMQTGANNSARQDRLWEREYGKYSSVKEKFNAVAKLLVGGNVRTFVSTMHVNNHDNFRRPNCDALHKGLLEKRNKIVHAGKLDYSRQDAQQALSQASNAFAIISAMESAHYDKLFRRGTTS
jgi:hypothetical protein